MENFYKPRREVDEESSLVIIYDIEIPVAASGNVPATVLRANLFRPKNGEHKKLPAILVMSPYGKDIHYQDFNSFSYADVPKEVKTKYMCWETPEPTDWCAQGYAILRIDERGFGHSPGYGDIWGSTLAQDFAKAIEWAHTQDWCDGKVGLFGVSYYGISQWFAAALRPKGLVCMLPWEGSSDMYRHAFRNGGIACNGFLHAWFPRQCSCNVYPGKGVKSELDKVPAQDRVLDTPEKVVATPYLSDDFYQSRVIDLGQIEVPLLSVANLGNVGLHLLGNVDGWKQAGSKHKWLYFCAGRHDTTMFLPESIELQRSFLDAYLKDNDRDGWLKPGAIKPVTILLRKSGADYKLITAQRAYGTRQESDWPVKGTEYTKWHIDAEGNFGDTVKASSGTLSWKALNDNNAILFKSPPADKAIEIMGHIVARLTVSLSADETSKPPKDIDLFLTVRHFDKSGKEVHYTGAIGGTVPVTKGWLRCSLRAVNDKHPLHKPWQPYREYKEKDVAFLEVGTKYTVDVEIWPTNLVLDVGERLALEVASGDTEGSDPFRHNDPRDRSPSVFGGLNHLHFGQDIDNYVLLPIIPFGRPI